MGALENAGPEPLDESLPAQTEPSRLFVVGGDDFDQHTGGGGYRNDVWYTTGAREWGGARVAQRRRSCLRVLTHARLPLPAAALACRLAHVQ